MGVSLQPSGFHVYGAKIDTWQLSLNLGHCKAFPLYSIFGTLIFLQSKSLGHDLDMCEVVPKIRSKL